MRLKDADLNVFTPKLRRNKILKEVNNALEVVDRLNDQIKIWRVNPKNIHTQLMQQELMYLKEGKIII